MRRGTALLGVLLLLLGVAVVVDRLAAAAVDRAVAARLAEAARLSATPQVQVRGFPFLTQAVRGRYEDVAVRASSVPVGALRLSTFSAQLHGVEVPLGDALSGSVTAVPVASIDATAVLGWADLTAALGDRGLSVSPATNGLVRVTGSLTVLGRTLEASALSRPVLQGREIVVTAERFEVGNSAADAVLSRALGSRLDFRLTLGALPFGLRLTSLTTGPDGVVLGARSDGAVLRRLGP